MKDKERRNLILSNLKEQGYISIKELGKICGTSLNTVRADVEKMCGENLVVKLHGGVILAQDDRHPLKSSNIRELYKSKEKQSIGTLVAQNLPKDKKISLFFDSSTTSLEVARALVNHPTAITAVTYYADVADILSQNAKNYVYFCGGRWISYEHITIGEETVSDISQYSVDYAILGCTGLELEGGIFNGSQETLVINQAMKKHAKQTWLVCADEKFDQKGLVWMSRLDEIHTIATNKLPSEEWITYCQNHNIQLLTPSQI